MIHYICDRCQCSMDPEEGPRYVVHIDVDVVNESVEVADAMQGDEATDYLADLNDALQSESKGSLHGNPEAVLEDEEALDYLNEVLSRGDECEFGDADHSVSNTVFSGDAESPDEATVQGKLEETPTSFDLCPECYAKYTQDPLSRDRAYKLHFSNN